MSKQIKTMDQLTDSRIMFEKKPPLFGYMIIVITALLIITIIIWSTFTPKTYMITALGTVTSENSSFVMPSYSGEIVDCYMSEGLIVGKGDILFTVRSTDYDLQEQQLVDNRLIYEKRISQYEKLVKSIKDDTNYFDASSSEDSLYYTSYEVYKAQIAQNEFDVSTYIAYGYTNEQIEVQIKANQNKIAEIYYSAIQSAESNIEECELQIASIDAQLSAITSGQDVYTVTAGESGTLHLLADYREGMVVQAGSAIATITPENSQVIIDAHVSTADMARMHVGDSVEMAVSGLTQTVYDPI